jgi:hypothetical protein
MGRNTHGQGISVNILQIYFLGSIFLAVCGSVSITATSTTSWPAVEALQSSARGAENWLVEHGAAGLPVIIDRWRAVIPPRSRNSSALR